MLVLSRRRNEAIIIGGNIRVTVFRISENSVQLTIEAPKDVPVDREEIAEAKRKEHGRRWT